MKITRVICQILRIEDVEAKTAGTQDTIVIRVQTDTGIEGIGEADASPSMLSGRDGKESKAIAQGWKKAGYKAIKLGWAAMRQSETLDIELVKGGREGIGDGTLLIDAGCVWAARTALRRAERFQEF